MEITRLYACVNENCKIEGNHVHGLGNKEVLMIDKDKNYLDVFHSEGTN